MKKIFFLFSFIIISFLYACDRNVVYEQNVDMPEREWDADKPAEFKVEITNTQAAHNIYVNVRNTGKYEFSNLYLFIFTEAPNGATISDTLECLLADQSGKWLGRGIGDIWSYQVPYKKAVRFSTPGDYTFEIKHGMRKPVLNEILDIGLRIEEIQ